MSCYVAEFSSGCRLRRVGSHNQSNSNLSVHGKNSNNGNSTNLGLIGNTGTSSIHGVLGDPTTLISLDTNLRSQPSRVSQKGSCFWLKCCCSCSW